MTRAALEHVLRAAAAITGEETFYVVGTAAIVAWLPSDAGLPDAILRSREADLIPASASERSIDLIDGALGHDSTFDATFGYYADGVDFSTVTFAPAGWKERTRRFASEGTRGAVGLCMEPHDLAIAKLCAARDKDLVFVRALAAIGLVRVNDLRERLAQVTAPDAVLDAASRTLDALASADRSAH